MTGMAVVTGANRGIGYEVVRQLAQHGFTVVLAARDAAKGEGAAAVLVAAGLDVHAVPVDVSDDASVRAFAQQVTERFGAVDVLVNNAGGFYDFGAQTVGAHLDSVHGGLDTNLFGAWRMTEALLPLLRQSAHGRIVNVSSEAGSFGSANGLTGMGGGLPAYGVSKAALNAYTRKLAAGLQSEGSAIRVNAVCPGTTATFEGGEAMGARPVPEGAASVVWAALVPDDGPTGGFFRDGQPLPW